MWCIILRNFKQFLISREIDYLSKLFLVASKCQVVFWNSVDVASSEESCEYAWLQWTLGHRDSWVVECGEWMWCPPLSLAPHFFVPLSVKALGSSPSLRAPHLPSLYPGCASLRLSEPCRHATQLYEAVTLAILHTSHLDTVTQHGQLQGGTQIEINWQKHSCLGNPSINSSLLLRVKC